MNAFGAHRRVRPDRRLQRRADSDERRPQLILVNRLKVQGFIVSEHMEHWPQALEELGSAWPAASSSTARPWPQGIEAAPEAFIGLLKGKNFGKQLVKLI